MKSVASVPTNLDGATVKEDGRGRKRGRHPENYRSEIRKRWRNWGESYDPQSRDATAKARTPRKEMKPPCNCQRLCPLVLLPEERSEIFRTFWELGDLQMQRQFVLNNVSIKEIKR